MSNDNWWGRRRRYEPRQSSSGRDAPEVHPVEEEPPTQPQPRIRRRWRRVKLTPQLAADVGLVEIRPGEWVYGAAHVPKRTIKDSYKRPDGTLPWRILSLRRNMIYPKYDDIINSGHQYISSESAWTSFGLPVLLGICALIGLVVSLVAAWSSGHAGSIWAAICLVWLVWTPIWLYLRFLRWWADIFVIDASRLWWFSGWFMSESGWWQEGALAEVRHHFRGNVKLRDMKGKLRLIRWIFRWFASLLWRYLQVGDVELVDAAGTVFGVMKNRQDPRALAEGLLADMTTSTERAGERAAKAAEASVKAMEAMLEIARRQGLMTEMALREALRSRGLDEAAVDAFIDEHCREQSAQDQPATND